MIDKYEMIDQIIVNVDALIDARGAEKCRLGLDILQRLTALKKGLMDEEKARREQDAEAAAE